MSTIPLAEPNPAGTFAERLEDLATMLRAAGIEAATDPRDVNPPGVLLSAARLHVASKLCRGDRLEAALILFVPDSGDAAALEELAALWSMVGPAVGRPLNPDPGVFDRISLPSDPTGLPALRFTVTV